LGRGACLTSFGRIYLCVLGCGYNCRYCPFSHPRQYQHKPQKLNRLFIIKFLLKRRFRVEGKGKFMADEQTQAADDDAKAAEERAAEAHRAEANRDQEAADSHD